MLELHQFKHSPFCLKVRMALNAKELEYRTVEITPTIGQINIFQKTGQTKLPVLFDDEIALFNSRLIIRHLEKKKAEPRLIPDSPNESSHAQIIENWADTSLAKSIKNIFLEELISNSTLLSSLFNDEIPYSMKNFLIKLPLNIPGKIYSFVNQEEKESLKLNLEILTEVTKNKKFIVGETISIADIAVAAQLSLLRFPQSSGDKLSGKGCNLFSKDPRFECLFEWRDKIENKLITTNVNDD